MSFYLTEVSFLGVTIQPAVPILVLSIIPAEIIRRVLIRLKISGMIWNWPLMLIAIYALIVSGLILALQPL